MAANGSAGRQQVAAVRPGVSTPVTRAVSRRQRAVFAPSVLEAANDDVCYLILGQIPSRDLTALRQVSRRWVLLVRRAWPSICLRRFPCFSGIGAIHPSFMWQLAVVDQADEARLFACLCTLAKLERAWPGAVSMRCDEHGGINCRLQKLRSLPANMRLPADAALFMLLGVTINGASPIATISGDFGPEYAAETPREPWRVATMWLPLEEQYLSAIQDAAAAAALAAAAEAQLPADGDDEPEQQPEHIGHPAAGVEAGDAAAEPANEPDGVAAPADDDEEPPIAGSHADAISASSGDVRLHEPLSLSDFGAFFDHPMGEDDPGFPMYRRIYQRNATSMLLIGQFANLSDGQAGAHLPLFLDCDPQSDAEFGGALHFVVFDAEPDDLDAAALDYRFEARVGGKPLTLTGLLERMSEMLRPLEGSGLSWEEAWRQVDLYGGLIADLDAPSDDVDSSIEDDSVGSLGDSEELVAWELDLDGEDESQSSDQSYPASMLGDETDNWSDHDSVHSA